MCIRDRGFIDVFDEEAHKIKDVKWLAQGTIYPDSVSYTHLVYTMPYPAIRNLLDAGRHKPCLLYTSRCV